MTWVYVLVRDGILPEGFEWASEPDERYNVRWARRVIE